ncbi:MAG: DSD1 family PLP-dependent enzyme [Ectothiorhodospiraceae bacterium]|nr:DSD1 family PLP-dependent enzyme [Chromatiales bacterium]MCP5154065.1 DSD1 family PLP-dependent enzyme [Ectothiorhodospiraceae bacterium]
MSAIVGAAKSELDTPALLVDLDVLERNIERMRRTIIGEAGVGWRPHTKAMKTPALAHMCIAAGAHGVTCAKLGEAEVMADAGIRDVLIANQIVGPRKIARLVALARRADPIVCVDHIDNVREIDRAAGAVGSRPRVLIEIDVGMARAGVAPGPAAVELARQIASLDHVRFAGLQTWESHALGAPDAQTKHRLVGEALARVAATADAIRAAGIAVDIVSCGGTGTYWISAFEPGVTEVEAGGGIYCDVRYRDHFGVDHEFALTVLATVTSRPTPTRIICDAGFKTMSGAHGAPRPLGIDAVRSVALSAEHGTIELDAPSPTPRVGDTIELVPGYSDSTVFLHDALVATRGERVEAVWPLLGRGKLA